MTDKKKGKSLGGIRSVTARPLPRSRDSILPTAVKGRPSTSTATVDARRRTKRKRAGGPSWEELHQRVTFHCPRDLLDLLDRAADEGTRSKSEIIVAALRRELSVGG